MVSKMSVLQEISLVNYEIIILDPGARLGVEKSHISGDSWQQGGTVILDKETRVIYKHQESHPADWPNMEEILPLVGIENTSVEYKKAVSDWLEVRRSNRQQKT